MKPQAKPKKPLAAYLRLTVDRDGRKIGYDVQQAAIERWADYAGETVGRWYKDKDVTAADRNIQRDDYEKMLADVEAGLWGGIVVWRLDRLVRLVYEFERCFRIVEDANGLIVSLDPSVIRSDDELGKMFMRLLVMFAEMEISTMKSRAKGHRRERAKQGMAHGGGARAFGFVGAERDEFGRYLNVGKVGVDHFPEEVELARQAARRLVHESWTWTDVLNDWNQRNPPVVGTTGMPFSMTTLQQTLTSLRAAGLREYEEEDAESGETVKVVRKAVWEPILDKDTWDSLKAIIKRRTPSGPKRTYRLSGVVLCGRCSMPLKGRQREITLKGESVKVLNYFCKSGPNERVKGRCGRLEVRQGPVDEIVRAFIVKRFTDSPTALDDLQSEPLPYNATLNEALRELQDTQERLNLLASAFGASTLSWEEYEMARQPLVLRKEQAESTMKRISTQAIVPAPMPSDFADLGGWYDGLNMNQQVNLINALIVSVSVNPGYSGPRFDPERVVLVARRVHDLQAGG